MRRIEWTNAFKRDFKRHGSFESPFIEALWKLANDEPLSERYYDHPLVGNWKDHSDCHSCRQTDESLFWQNAWDR